MDTTKDKPLDVLIAGAGPVGLMMACQLALHKIKFRIIDKKTSSPRYSGALIIHARTMEIFHQMGLAEKIMNTGIIARTIHMRFNRQKNYSLDISNFGKGLTCYPFLLLSEQWQTEQLLKEFLYEQHHQVEQGISLTGFKQQDGLVYSEITGPDGSSQMISSRFLIGADGKDSFVRNHLKIPFPGKTQSSRLFITDCQARLPLSDREIFFLFTPEITSGFFPLKNSRWRVDGLIPVIQHQEVNFEEVGHFFFSKSQCEIELHRADWFSVFRSHSRCAGSFAFNHCFLMGDAAHVHTPVGAQGMNTGMQDACNLAWKLAMYIHGKAGEKLLDSYQQERRPVALNAIRYTDLAYSFMTTNSFIAKYARLHLLPLLMPRILSWFHQKQELRKRIFVAISGIGISYKNSPRFSSMSENGFAAHAPHPGDRLPYVGYEKNGSQYALHNDLSLTHYTLLVFGSPMLPQRFQRVLFKYKAIISIKYLDENKDTRAVFDQLGLTKQGCYLIRPDMYVAWRSHDFNAEQLNEYLENVLQ